MSGQDFTHEDERRFEAYMDALSVVLNHKQRIVPLKGYCTGLPLPIEGKTMETSRRISRRIGPWRCITAFRILSPTRLGATPRCSMRSARGSSTTPVYSRRAAVRSGCRASIVASWARSTTVRSYGAKAAFRRGVSDLGLPYAVAVPDGVRIVPPANRR